MNDAGVPKEGLVGEVGGDHAAVPQVHVPRVPLHYTLYLPNVQEFLSLFISRVAIQK